MAGTVRKLVTSWGFDVDDSALKTMDKNIEKTKESLKTLGERVIEVAGSMFGIAEITALAGKEAGENADRLNMNAQEYQAYSRAANMAGVSTERFAMGMNLMTKQAVDAGRGNEEAAETFAQMGVNVYQANGQFKTGGQLLRSVADGLLSVKDKALRLQLADKLFGERNSQMLTFLTQGSKGMQQFMKEGSKFDFIMGDQAIEASKKFDESVEKTKYVLYGLRNLLGLELMPIIRGLLEQFMNWVATHRALVRQDIHGFATALVQAFRALYQIVVMVAHLMKIFTDAVGGAKNATTLFVAAWAIMKFAPIVMGIYNIAKALGILKVAFKLISLAFMESPFGLIIAGVIGLLLVLQDLFYFIEGKNSAIGHLVKALGPIFSPFKGLMGGATSVGGLLPHGVKDSSFGAAMTGRSGVAPVTIHAPVHVHVGSGTGNAHQTGTIIGEAVSNHLHKIHRDAMRDHQPGIQH